MTRQFLILTVFILTTLTACKNYYNDTIYWADDIKRGTDIQTIKSNQPDFFEVEWDKPDTLDNQLRYEILNIKGSNDPLKMQHFLVFIDNKFEGRSSIK